MKSTGRWVRIPLGCLERAMRLVFGFSILYLTAIFLVLIPHFVFNFCPFFLKGWDDDTAEVPLCHVLPTAEGLADDRVVYGPEGPSLFSAVCPHCRFFPVRFVPAGFDDESEIDQRIGALRLDTAGRAALNRLQARLAESQGDRITAATRTGRGFVLAGSGFHGLFIYDSNSPDFIAAPPLAEEGGLQDTIWRVATLEGDTIEVAYDLWCPTFVAVSICRVASVNDLRCRRIK